MMTRKYYVQTQEHSRMLLRLRTPNVFPKVDLDLELSVNNFAMAMEVVLNGLVRGNVSVRKRILSKLHKLSTWPVFDTYFAYALMESLRDDIDLKIGEDYIFGVIARYGPEVDGNLLTKRSVKGILANTSHALSLRPTRHQIGKALKVVQEIVDWEDREGRDYWTIMRRFLPANELRLQGASRWARRMAVRIAKRTR